MSRWVVIDRHCGRTFEADREDLPDECPHCGHKPLYVDFVEEIDDPVEASSAAAELARAHGIDLSTVEPTGKDGSVIKADVQAAIAERKESGDPDQGDHPDSGSESKTDQSKFDQIEERFDQIDLAIAELQAAIAELQTGGAEGEGEDE